MLIYFCELQMLTALIFSFRENCVFILMDFPNELEIKLDSKLSL